MRRCWVGTVAAVLAGMAGTAVAEDPKAAARAMGQAGLQSQRPGSAGGQASRHVG